MTRRDETDVACWWQVLFLLGLLALCLPWAVYAHWRDRPRWADD